MLVKAKSKIYIAGEYAVLRKGSYALIAAVDKYTYLNIEKSEKEEVISPIKDKDNILKYAREQAFLYVGKYEKFKYTYSTDLYKGNKKIGLGSSASVVVVTIKSILEYFGLKYTKDDLFLLSVHALKKAGQTGSMGDVACICFEDLILYKSIDDNDNFEVKIVKPKGVLKIDAIWSGIEASTKKQISPIKNIYNTKNFQKFCDISDKLTLNLVNLIEKGENNELENYIEKLKCNLEFLQNFSKINIVSESLKKIINENKRRKTSGAGLGDFVIEVSLVYDEKRSAYVVCTRL